MAAGAATEIAQLSGMLVFQSPRMVNQTAAPLLHQVPHMFPLFAFEDTL